MMDTFDATLALYGQTVPAQATKRFSDAGPLVAIYRSRDFGERYSEMAVGNGNPPIWTPAFQVLVCDPRPGDLLTVHGQCQVKTLANTNTELLHRVRYTYGSGDNSGNTPEVSEELGENIDLARHYFDPVCIGEYELPADHGVGSPQSPLLRYLTWQLSANRDNAIQPLKVDICTDYSRLIVHHWRPPS